MTMYHQSILRGMYVTTVGSQSAIEVTKDHYHKCPKNRTVCSDNAVMCQTHSDGTAESVHYTLIRLLLSLSQFLKYFFVLKRIHVLRKNPFKHTGLLHFMKREGVGVEGGGTKWVVGIYEASSVVNQPLPNTSYKQAFRRMWCLPSLLLSQNKAKPQNSTKVYAVDTYDDSGKVIHISSFC